MCLLNTALQSTVGGEQTTEDDPEGEDEEMEEAAEEEIHSGQGEEELRHGAPQSASSDEDIVRVIGEKTNWEIKKLKQKSWVRNNSINYIHSLLSLMSYQHRRKNQPFVNADINKSTKESYPKEDDPNYMSLVNRLVLHWKSLE